MDPNFTGASDFINCHQFGEDGTILVSEDPNQQHATNWDVHQPYGRSFVDVDPPLEGQGASVATMSITSVMDHPSLQDTDFSETFKFISQVLMEENIEQRPFCDSLSLQVTEKSFHDALIHKLPNSPNTQPLDINGTNNLLDDNSPCTTISVLGDHDFHHNSHAISHTPFQPPSAGASDGVLDLESSVNKLLEQNIFTDTYFVSQFKRGLEEVSNFLPPGPRLVADLESKEEATIVVGENPFGLKGGRKNHQREESDTPEEGKNNKQSAVGVVDEGDLSDLFDRLMLSVEGEPGEKQPSSDGGKARPKKQGRKKKTVDLSTLLLLCSQALHANDNRTANELLKQIRQHSSPFGDASQRLAHYFSNGLEARLDGGGTVAKAFYSSPSSKTIGAAEFLKGYQASLCTCPFKKFAFYFANKMIVKAAEKAETLHIIDFGILYGFQWPLLIKLLLNREGGPPKLRITGIEFPEPGFRPRERIEETGRRLADYCKRFNVPFEYNAIASRNWEIIRVEDLKIESNEVVAVNSLMRFKNLLDETFEVNSPRNAVLHLIRKINPNIFTQFIANGSYNAPWFATRFKAALFHFSAFYDMFDTVMPCKDESRMLIEREILGREAMNVIACEGLERVERPETYKKWQVRNTRVGFKQLPLNQELMAQFRTELREGYHRDFVFDEDNNWMLQGWRGRVLYASTCWVPA